MAVLTITHVIISLIGIFSGFVVLAGLLTGKPLGKWNILFLWSTIETSVTGFFFPFVKVTPGHIIGALSLIILALALYALYGKKLAGFWRKTYVVTAVTALYFNTFVLVVQGFRHVPLLHALAPTESEPPFAIAQGILFVIFAALGFLAVKNFREQPVTIVKPVTV